MATFFVRVTPIKRAEGRSVIACAAYRAGAKLHDQRLGQTFDYSHKSKRTEIVATGIVAPEAAADWMADRGQLWNEIERLERRKDARPAREILIALPHELTDSERRQLLEGFLHDHVAARGMIADFAIHRPAAPRSTDEAASEHGPDQRNHHAHVLVTTRAIVMRDGEAEFGLKPQDWNDRGLITAWRREWADSVNRKFAELGHDIRIDHRSYRDRGIDREPEPTVGVAATQLARKGKGSERQEERDAAKLRNSERAQRIANDNDRSDFTQLKPLSVADDASRRLADIRSKLMAANDLDDDAKKRIDMLREDQIMMNDRADRDAEQIDMAVKQQQRLLGIQEKERSDSDKQKRLALEEEEQKKLVAGLLSGQQVDSFSPERSITQVNDRFRQALQAAGYDPARHYEGMSKAVWIEAQKLKTEQFRLATQIKGEQDSTKRQGLILRYEIQFYDYMAASQDRVATMARAIGGRDGEHDIARKNANASREAAAERRELYTQHFSAQSRSQQQSVSSGRATAGQSRDEAQAHKDDSKIKSWGGRYSAARYSATKHEGRKEREGENTDKPAKDNSSGDRDRDR